MSQLWRRLRLLFSSLQRQGWSMRLRLGVFLALIAAQVLVLVLMILVAAGVFDVSKQQLAHYLSWELDQQKRSLERTKDAMAIQGIHMTRELDNPIQSWLSAQSLELPQLARQPEQIETLLSLLTPTLASHLENGPVSGTFVMLDTSCQAGQAGDRAGVLLRNLEPNALSLSPANIWMKYGPFEVSRQHGVRILPQWRIEFPVRMQQLYQGLIQSQAAPSATPLSFYMTGGQSLDHSDERAIYVLFPLHDEAGKPIGVCGFEFNAVMFKLMFAPHSADYPSAISLFARYEESVGLKSVEGLAASTWSGSDITKQDWLKMDRDFGGGLSQFYGDSIDGYVGQSVSIPVYARSSPYAHEQWRLAVVIPQRDFLLRESQNRVRILFWALAAFSLNMLLIVALILIYMRPIQRTLEQIASGEVEEGQRTGIIEIDDLLLFLNEQEEKQRSLEASLSRSRAIPMPGTAAPRAAGGEITEEAALAFRDRVASLSPAERAVFDLYMEGHNAREITELLFLSINTIKTHNKRIYMKLHVGSRRELLDYVYYLEDRGMKPGLQDSAEA